VSARGERTRARIIDAAEQLFAQRGVAGVSLREITASAGQRNTNALQYHFGDRDGLLAAIAERHLAILNERQDAMLEARRRERVQWSLREQVDLLVRPTAEYIADGPSARAWLQIVSQLATGPRVRAEDTAAAISKAAIEVGTALVQRLEPELGAALAIERVRMTSEGVLHLIADRARLEDSNEPRRPVMPLPLFVELVIDMTTAAMTAPASTELLGAAAAAGAPESPWTPVAGNRGPSDISDR
jgi:AcrR family transcriptional regulator